MKNEKETEVTRDAMLCSVTLPLNRHSCVQLLCHKVAVVVFNYFAIR